MHNYFAPLHLQPYFRELGYREGDFPVTEFIASTTIALPFYTGLRSEEVARVSDALRRALAQLGVTTAGAPRRRTVAARRSTSSSTPQRTWRSRS